MGIVGVIGMFLLGMLIGFIAGTYFFSYLVVEINKVDPDRFDRLIADIRKKLKEQDN